MEKALTAKWGAAAIADAKVDPKKLLADIHATSEYRASLVKAMAKRAVAKAK
jgi:carbon-monoxide dehydrogenase medium subunit